MAKKVLQIIESAYRGTLEEQDDTIIWLTHAMANAGGQFGILLRGNAVNYAVKGQDAAGLAFGERKQTQPPRIMDDLAKVMDKGVEVHLVQDDAAERGLERGDLIAGIKLVPRSGIPKLIQSYDQVWHW